MAVSPIRLSILVLALVLSSSAFAADSVGWSQWRGPSDGGLTVGGELPDQAFGLKVAWTRDLGSGYSSVWPVGGKAVTMFASGEDDVVAAIEPGTGEELWRYELGPTYAGHDNSDDGPIGTPVVRDGTVYALGPFGQLVALALADGSEQWRRELTEDDSTVPFYGYATVPVVTASDVIVSTGGEGHALTAFDRKTGKPKWTAGDDTVSYQSPTLVDLGGRQVLIALTDHFVTGVDPKSGDVLWEARHTEDGQIDNSSHATAIDDERFLVKLRNGSRLYRVNKTGVEEVWQSRAFGNTLALPVLIGDHLYGFSGNVMTCASVETGEFVWRSRDLNSFGLSAVDGKLAVISNDGQFVLVDASPDGYRELARVPVFEVGDYAVPSFSDGHFFVRNLAQMAAIRVDTSVAPQVAERETVDRHHGEFGTWIASVEKLPESKRQAMVDRRLASVESTPLAGEDGLAHLIWRGEADDVAVRGDVAAGVPELELFGVAGTDLFYRSLELDAKAQYTYAFTVDFGNPQSDPRNPNSVDNGFAVFSELRMPEWPASPFLDSPAEDAARGTLDGFPFRSEILDNTREIKVWRPAGYGRNPEGRYPVLVVNHGDNLLRGGLMQNALDNLVGDSVAPLIAVFVPRANAAEFGGPAGADYTRFLIEELLPHLDRHYRTDSDRRSIMGPGSAGVAAVFASLAHPEVFRQAAVQSFYPIEPTHAQLPELIAASGAKPALIYMVWSRRDYDLGDGRKAEDASRELAGRLRAADLNVTEQVSDYSPGWGGWRGQYDEILAALFPLESSE